MTKDFDAEAPSNNTKQESCKIAQEEGTVITILDLQEIETDSREEIYQLNSRM